jgi:hypothetical protein
MPKRTRLKKGKSFKSRKRLSRFALRRAWNKLDDVNKNVLKKYYTNKILVSGMSVVPATLFVVNLIHSDIEKTKEKFGLRKASLIGASSDEKQAIKEFVKLYHQEKKK